MEKAYSCGISKIDLRELRFSKAINNVNICLPHDECYGIEINLKLLVFI
jgi:hypothetical protein